MDDPTLSSLLNAASEGDPRAAEEFLPEVYKQLRELASARLRKVPPGQTLQATALVHEVYLRIADQGNFDSRRHFFFAAARAMQNILVEDARRKARLKRGGDRQRVEYQEADLIANAPTDDMLGLSEALERLQAEYPRKHQLVMLRFFAGFTEEEAAELLEVDARTARRDWRFARVWLHDALGSALPEDDPDS